MKAVVTTVAVASASVELAEARLLIVAVAVVEGAVRCR